MYFFFAGLQECFRHKGIYLRRLLPITFAIIILLSGCSQKMKGLLVFNDPSLTNVWPPPPEQPRIKMLKVFRGAGEFMAPKSRLQSMFEAITGEREKPVEFMAPAGVVSDGERYIYVADPSARLVHKFDFIENEVTYLTHSGVEPLASPVGVALDSDGNCYVTDSVKAKVYKYRPGRVCRIDWRRCSRISTTCRNRHWQKRFQVCCRCIGR